MLSPEKLKGFEDEIVDVLALNTLLPAWFPEAAAEQFLVQLERVEEAMFECGF